MGLSVRNIAEGGSTCASSCGAFAAGAELECATEATAYVAATGPLRGRSQNHEPSANGEV